MHYFAYSAELSKEDQVLQEIYHFLTTLAIPEGHIEQQQWQFIKRATKFFVRDEQLYKRNGVNQPLRAIVNLPTDTTCLNKLTRT